MVFQGLVVSVSIHPANTARQKKYPTAMTGHLNGGPKTIDLKVLRNMRRTLKKPTLDTKTTSNTLLQAYNPYTRQWCAMSVRLAVAQLTADITTMHAQEVLARGGLDYGQNYTVSDFCMTTSILKNNCMPKFS